VEAQWRGCTGASVVHRFGELVAVGQLHASTTGARRPRPEQCFGTPIPRSPCCSAARPRSGRERSVRVIGGVSLAAGESRTPAHSGWVSTLVASAWRMTHRARVRRCTRELWRARRWVSSRGTRTRTCRFGRFGSKEALHDA
jgi:hypothetical protein